MLFSVKVVSKGEFTRSFYTVCCRERGPCKCHGSCHQGVQMYSMQGRFPHQTGWAPSQTSGVRVREGPPQLSHTSRDFGICRPSRFLRALFPGPEWIWAHSLEAESWLSKNNLGIAAHSPASDQPRHSHTTSQALPVS